MEIAMKVIDVRFRDPVQVGGITASARVSWRREDGPCSVSDGYVTCGDTLVPLTNVAWLRLEPFVAPASERIDVTEQATDLDRARADAATAGDRRDWDAADRADAEIERLTKAPAPGKGKKR